MKMTTLDHIVLTARDVGATVAFYRDVLGMEPREERPGKWSLHFGAHKISLQREGEAPAIARGTLPGTGNFCLLTETPMARVVGELEKAGVAILEGPAERIGATGPIRSVYFNDPDGNLVEVSNTV